VTPARWRRNQACGRGGAVAKGWRWSGSDGKSTGAEAAEATAASGSRAAIGPTTARGSTAGVGPAQVPRQVQSFGALSPGIEEWCEPWWAGMTMATDRFRLASAWGQLCSTIGAAITRPNQIVSTPARDRDHGVMARIGTNVVGIVRAGHRIPVIGGQPGGAAAATPGGARLRSSVRY